MFSLAVEGSVNCAECRGACCEAFAIPIEDLRPPDPDAMLWVALHSKQSESDSGPIIVTTGDDGKVTDIDFRGASYLEFECRCTRLDPDGRCSIYNLRPQVCRDFEPGGEACLEMVRDRRTHEQFLKIREPGDPLVIHEFSEKS